MKNNIELKLIDYILGNISAADDPQLCEILKTDGIDNKINEIADFLNLLSTDLPKIQPTKQLTKNIFATISKSNRNYLMGFSKRLSSFFQLPHDEIVSLLKMVKHPFNKPWESTFLEGAHFLHFDGGGDYKKAHCGIIHLNMGAEIKNHKHIGDELMFVLDGNVTSNNGKQYNPGDVLVCKDQTTHSLLGNKNHECVFAVIAMHDVKFL